MLYVVVKDKRLLKHMSRPKCEEIIYHVKAQPEFNRMVTATENILKIEIDRLSILSQLEEEKKKTFAVIVRQRNMEQAYK
jgi:hypothetical protein